MIRKKSNEVKITNIEPYIIKTVVVIIILMVLSLGLLLWIDKDKKKGIDYDCLKDIAKDACVEDYEHGNLRTFEKNMGLGFKCSYSEGRTKLTTEWLYFFPEEITNCTGVKND